MGQAITPAPLFCVYTVLLAAVRFGLSLRRVAYAAAPGCFSSISSFSQSRASAVSDWSK